MLSQGLFRKSNFTYIILDFILNRGSRLFIFFLLSTQLNESGLVSYVSFEASCFFFKSLFSISLKDKRFRFSKVEFLKESDFFWFYIFIGIFLVPIALKNVFILSITFGAFMSRIDFFSLKNLEENILRSKIIESIPNVIYSLLIFLLVILSDVSVTNIFIVKNVAVIFPLIILLFLFPLNFKLKIPSIDYSFLTGLFFTGIVVYERLILYFNDFPGFSRSDLFINYFGSIIITLSINFSNILWSKNDRLIFDEKRTKLFYLIILIFLFLGIYLDVYGCILVCNSILVSVILVKRHILVKSLSVFWFTVFCLMLITSFCCFGFVIKEVEWIIVSFSFSCLLLLFNLIIFYEEILFSKGGV